ncbi:MAG: esterase [Firmicutes bacterium]|nr:esterase [Bacillota bacterium]
MKKTVIGVLVVVLFALGISVCLANGNDKAIGDKVDSSSGHIKGATAITEVFGDGQKISAVALEYDAPIDTAKLKPSDFTVAGKNIIKIYANTKAEKAIKGVSGKYVILELATPMIEQKMEGDLEKPLNHDEKSEPKGIMNGPQLGSRPDKQPSITLLAANIKQLGNVTTAAGEIYDATSNMITSTKTINLVVDDFKQLVYKDPKYNNKSLMYNLYVPKNYDPAKKYPLVLFIHDAGAVSDNPTTTLTQGLGAVIWATPSEQAKHECFVLAPQYTTVIADDNSQTTEQMDITVDLLKNLEKQYSIDTTRLYNTGQSMGGMTSIAMDIKYPDLFAASLLVACQWDSEKVKPMAKKNLWIVVSEGDNKAYPGMNAITDVLKSQGATVSYGTWSAQSNTLKMKKNVDKMLKANCNVNYTVFKNGNHRYTWQYAYTIEGIRDWVFTNKRFVEAVL